MVYTIQFKEGESESHVENLSCKNKKASMNLYLLVCILPFN